MESRTAKFEYCQEGIQSGAHYRKVFEEMRKSSELTDISIRIGNTTLAAHRVILAAVIPYFRIHFLPKWSDSKKKIVTFQNVEPDAMDCLINFAYTGRISIVSENVRNLLIAADFFLLREIREACFEFLKNHIRPDNVLDIRGVGDALCSSDFVKKVDDFIDENFDALYKTEGFLNMPLCLLKEIISRKLRARNENNVFKAITAWINANPLERNPKLFELWSCVQMSLPAAITKQVHRPSKPKSFSLADMVWIQGDIFGIYIVSSSSSYDRVVHNYNSHTKEWSMVAKNIQCKSFTNVVSSCGVIYVFTINDLEVFDSHSWKSHKLHPYDVRRGAGNAVSHGNKIYWFPNILNGTCSVWCFDTENFSWNEEIPSLKLISSGFVSSFPSRVIYILGGITTSSSVIADANIYDTQNKQFEGINPMLSRRSSPGCAILKDKIYVCGGYNGFFFLDTAEVYDPHSYQWRSISKMRKQWSNFSLVPCDGWLYAIGTLPNGEINVEIYEPEKKKWKHGQDIPGQYNFLTAVTIYI